MTTNNPKQFKIALAGQPNAGKTSIFNALTGSTGHVGNYPGVTVERREGSYAFNKTNFQVTDLPGTYSLSSFSPEERIAQSELLDNPPDVVVVVLDSTALTRSLVFFAQIAQTKAKSVLVLNMADEAKAAGQHLDLEQMSSLLGCPVIQTVGHKRKGIDALKSTIEKVATSSAAPRLPVLGERLTAAIGVVERKLTETGFDKRHHTWVACKLLQGDKAFTARATGEGDGGRAAIAAAAAQRTKIEQRTGRDMEIFVAERYHGFAHGLVTEVLLQRPRADARAVSDLVDRVLADKVLGLPMFIGIMYAIFWVTFTVGDIPMGWIETGFEYLGATVGQVWPGETAPAMRSLVLDGIIGGVGGVVVFLPNILLLFLGLAILEDTGYMARAAFIIDQLMHRFGLHGKSFLPLLTGFGCSIPGIMATRTLENERDRLTTMLVLPLMSCGARLPIWMLLVPAFFAEEWRTSALMIIYLVGAVLALLLALLLRKTVFSGKEAPFVMELPPYRIPTLRAMFGKMSERSGLYLKKAGTVILGISIVMWFITAFPKVDSYAVDREIAAGRIEIVEAPEQVAASQGAIGKITVTQVENRRSAENIRGSFAGKIGQLLEPVLRPLGFDWKLATGMIGAFAAKEVFVAQMGIVHALGETDEESSTLREYLSSSYSPLVGISLILFLLIATPCMATVAVTKRESGGWKWAIYQFAGLTVVAYVISLVVFQGGRLAGLG
ncbi:MAG: ferrous iron transport protein B [Proteobacteria bacterium]|nr:ferrous iron transport protein B [Pseudomonadota bacterium]